MPTASEESLYGLQRKVAAESRVRGRPVSGRTVRPTTIETKSEYDFSHGRRGAVLPARPGTTRITIRIDDEILEWFRRRVHAAGGGNYQEIMNQVLREYVERMGSVD